MTARRLRLLGPIEVHVDGAPTALEPDAARLLARLASSGGAVVPADELTDLAGGGVDVTTLAASVDRVLGGNAVVADPTGYRLDLDDIDVRRFEQLVDESSRVGPSDVIPLLDEALSLWRGQPLAEFAGEPWADAEAERMHGLRRRAVEDRVDSLLLLDRVDDAIESVDEFVREAPGSDRLQGLLMWALAAAGRHAEALDSYQRHRRRLAAALPGAEPSWALRSIERRIASTIGSDDETASDDRPSGVITVVFTDIERSTQLWVEHAEVMERNVERHDTIVRELVVDHDGYVFSTAGDSFGVAFHDPCNAARFAVTLQQRLQREPWPAEAPIRVRMGLHRGRASERDGNYFGSTLNLAARIEEAANGGQIIASADVVDLLDDETGRQDRGKQLLRDIPEPVHLYQLEVPGIETTSTPMRRVSRSISNLPAQRGALTGRTEATVEVRRLLARDRLVTLAGPGGMGKTRLAIHVAGEESLGSRDTVLWIDLGARDVDVESAFLAAVGLSRIADQSTIDQLVPLLLGRRALLVVDNCEHVLDDAAPLIDLLLDQLPELAVLATSREPLGLVAEHVWRVPPLETHPAGSAIRLFEERASAADPEFRLDESNLDLVIELCRRLDGLPLAIELAASRKEALSLRSILAGLDDRFRLLRTTARGRVERHRRIEEVVAWSFDLCTDDERRLLERLVPFPSTFARDDVAGVAGIDPIDATDLLDSLVTKSLVQVVRLPGDRIRYRLLESIKEFGSERLVAVGELEAARDRHLAHFVATEGAPTDLDLAAITRRIQLPEFDNLRAAADWALERGDPAAATSLTIGRTLAIVEHGGADRVIDWLSGRDQLSVNDRLWALNGCAYAALALGEHEQVSGFVDEAIELAAGEPFDAMPNTHCFLAFDQVIDDPDAALASTGRAQSVAPSTPSGSRHLPMVRYATSLTLLHLAEYDDALDAAQTAIEVAGEHSPYRAVSKVVEMVARLASDDVEASSATLQSVSRPVVFGAQEWLLRLFDLIHVDAPDDERVRRLARGALSRSGSHPVQQARDLLAVMAYRRLRDGAADAEQLALGGLSGSVPGALAFATLARIRGVEPDAWPGWRRELGSWVRSVEARDLALRLVREQSATRAPAS